MYNQRDYRLKKDGNSDKANRAGGTILCQSFYANYIKYLRCGI